MWIYWHCSIDRDSDLGCIIDAREMVQWIWSYDIIFRICMLNWWLLVWYCSSYDGGMEIEGQTVMVSTID